MTDSTRKWSRPICVPIRGGCEKLFQFIENIILYEIFVGRRPNVAAGTSNGQLGLVAAPHLADLRFSRSNAGSKPRRRDTKDKIGLHVLPKVLFIARS